MNVLLVGDVVGRPGVDITIQALPGLRRKESIDVVIVNGENADSGSGITPSIYRKLTEEAGADCITLGDHAFRKRDILETLKSQSNIIRPANFPPDAPGNGMTLLSRFGQKIAVINLIGRVFMKPFDCPFQEADRLLKQLEDDVKIRIVDFHAEATSDMQLMGRYLDGRVSAVLGTHTHVPTADEQILPGGTAFQCDVGMTGPHDSILGRNTSNVLETTITFWPKMFHVAEEDVQLSATLVKIDEDSGKATDVRRIKVDEEYACELGELD